MSAIINIKNLELCSLELYSKKREVVKKPKILSIRVMTELYKQELLVNQFRIYANYFRT